ncbi:c-type cytochrome [Cohnella sp.]|uniref:c-type cytochrome n=1 Tax=Cohnella sp. TaxID=1883426 RepID=UPI00356B2910
MKRIATLLSLILVIAMTGCGGGNTNENTTPVAPDTQVAPTPPAADSPAADTVNAAEAEALYKKNCIGCHAVDLGGGAGPNLQRTGANLSIDEIHNRISEGRGGMPAFEGKLTDDQIQILTQWLASKS